MILKFGCNLNGKLIYCAIFKNMDNNISVAQMYMLNDIINLNV